MSAKFVYSKKYEVEMDGHPWQVNKYRDLQKLVLSNGLARKEDMILVEEASDEDIALVHTPEYIEKLQLGFLTAHELMRTELPFSPELVHLFWAAAEGTSVACREALKHGAAFHLGGGFHHAFADAGTGFCLVNDIAVGLRKTKKEKLWNRAMVVDLDVHQGDGTAKIFENDPTVFTFSMHQENNFPYPKQAGSLDVSLKDGMKDAEYLAELEKHLPKILEAHKPELIVYVAGADGFENDLLGGLKLSIQGLKSRDEAVFREAGKRSIPVAVTLAGGYAENPQDTLKIHLNTIRIGVGKP